MNHKSYEAQSNLIRINTSKVVRNAVLWRLKLEKHLKVARGRSTYYLWRTTGKTCLTCHLKQKQNNNNNNKKQRIHKTIESHFSGAKIKKNLSAQNFISREIVFKNNGKIQFQINEICQFKHISKTVTESLSFLEIKNIRQEN